MRVTYVTHIRDEDFDMAGAAPDDPGSLQTLYDLPVQSSPPLQTVSVRELTVEKGRVDRPQVAHEKRHEEPGPRDGRQAEGQPH